MTLSVRNCLE